MSPVSIKTYQNCAVCHVLYEFMCIYIYMYYILWSRGQWGLFPSFEKIRCVLDLQGFGQSGFEGTKASHKERLVFHPSYFLDIYQITRSRW